MKGIILRYIGEKGFGFIKGEDGREYFFHKSSLGGRFTPAAGNLITFDVTKGKKGLAATNVGFIGNGSPPSPEFEYPRKMMYSNDSVFPGGFQVIREVCTLWAKAKGYRAARNELLNLANKQGANAVVITSEEVTQHEETTLGGWLSIFALFSGRGWGRGAMMGGYKYNMVTYHGRAVVVAREKHRR